MNKEKHYSSRLGWIRAAVLGANDGIVSIASLIIGVAAAGASRGETILAGAAAIAAGAMSMAAGEYVSVSSQSDTEKADLQREREEHETNPEYELQELTDIYIGRGLDPVLAKQVAVQLSEKDALAAHARDELGHSRAQKARPLQAALASALAFTVGATAPMLVVLLVSDQYLISSIAVSSLVYLALLGFLSARAGGANPVSAITRVTFWGALAMVTTAAIGILFRGSV